MKRLPARRSGQGVRPELVTAHGRLSSGQVSSFGGSERGDRESIFLPDIHRQTPPPIDGTLVSSGMNSEVHRQAASAM